MYQFTYLKSRLHAEDIMTAQEHLAKLGVTIDVAYNFIIGNLSNLESIYQTCKTFGVTNDMISEIVQHGGLKVSGEAVANYFASNGIDSTDLGGSAPSIEVVPPARPVEEESLSEAQDTSDLDGRLDPVDYDRKIFALLKEEGEEFVNDYTFTFDEASNTVTVIDQGGWYEEWQYDDNNQLIQRDIYSTEGLLYERGVNDYNEAGYLIKQTYFDYDLSSGESILEKTTSGENIVYRDGASGLLDGTSDFTINRGTDVVDGTLYGYGFDPISPLYPERVEFDLFNDGQIDFIQYFETDNFGNKISETTTVFNPDFGENSITYYDWILVV